jgi:hypothetical protein
MNRCEATEQMAVVAWCDLNNIPVFHIPNEAKRSYAAAATLKKMGMRKGVPDLCIPVPVGRHHGLFIEMKYNRNKTSPEQDRWLELLNEHGYIASVCWGFEEARQEIKDYLEGRHSCKS